jgi:tetratricopeptide (TPR) repeat protein
MSLRYLYGPVSGRFGPQNLRHQRHAGFCKTFGPGSDVRVLPGDNWDSICSRLPAGWRPDLIVLTLASTPVPVWAWSAPVPRVGLATGWPLLWHACCHLLGQCDLVLADPAGAERLSAFGISPVRAANLFGCEQAFLELAWPPAENRDVDVLVVTNLPPAALRSQLPLLGRLARASRRWRVRIVAGVYGKEYRQLLGRSRIVFYHSLAGEGSYRAFEAAAAGALLFQEKGNQDLPALLQDRQECVLYTEAHLEELLELYLANEAERRRLVEAARTRATGCSYSDLWEQNIALIEQELPAATTRRAARPAPSVESLLLGRCWHVLGQHKSADETLTKDLRTAVEQQPGSAALQMALGLALANNAATAAGAGLALPHFQAAVQADPANPFALLNVAEALARIGDKSQAVAQARRALDLLADTPQLTPAAGSSGHFPPEFDTFRVEWERAGWRNAGQPLEENQAKRDLLRWRLHALLAELTDALPSVYEAVLVRPDLPATRVLLGHMLNRAGQGREAAAHFEQALTLDPFHAEAARSLAERWHKAGEREKSNRLAEERRLLATAAPQFVAPEAWFAAAAAPSPARGKAEQKPPPPLPSAPCKAGNSTRRRRVSLTMIVRNEESHLPDCLSSVVDLVDEIIIADTGSTDRTREIALRFGARVVDFPWVDDFAAARNAALQQAAGDWVWWLDADDRLDADNRHKASELFDHLGDERDAYAMKVRSRLNAAGTAVRFLEQVRLFPNHPEIRWRYRVHEQIMPVVRQRGGDLRWADVTIDHVGYQDRDARRHKLERNLRLLRLEDTEHPDDPYTLFNLGWTLLDLGQVAESIECLNRSLRKVRPTASYLRKLYVLLIQGYNRLGERLPVLATCTEGLSRFPDDPELLFERAVVLHEDGKPAEAEASLRLLLALQPGRYLASVDAGLRGYRARHLLGEVCRVQGRQPEAEEHWRAAVAERPDYVPVWAALGQVWLEAGRWADVEEALRFLDAADPNGVDAVLLRARSNLARGNPDAAKYLLEQAIARNPKARPLRQLLQQVAQGRF